MHVQLYDILNYKLQTTLSILYMTLQDKYEHVSVSLSSGVYLLFTIVYVCYRMDNFVRDTDTHTFILLKSMLFFKNYLLLLFHNHKIILEV
jgi:hypothetical protein